MITNLQTNSIAVSSGRIDFEMSDCFVINWNVNLVLYDSYYVRVYGNPIYFHTVVVVLE